jgi:hypothetical protein
MAQWEGCYLELAPSQVDRVLRRRSNHNGRRFALQLCSFGNTAGATRDGALVLGDQNERQACKTELILCRRHESGAVRLRH